MTEDQGAGELWQTIQQGHRVFDVQARRGTPQTNGQSFVLLQDVQDIFPTASGLQFGRRVLGFMVDENGNRLQPLRVRHLPGTVLEALTSTAPRPPRSLPNSPPLTPTSNSTGSIHVLNSRQSSSNLEQVNSIPSSIPGQPRRRAISSRSPQVSQESEERLQILRQLQREMQEDEDQHSEYDLKLEQNEKLQQELLELQRLQQPVEVSRKSPFRPHEHVSIYSQLLPIRGPCFIPETHSDAVSTGSTDEGPQSQNSRFSLLYRSVLDGNYGPTVNDRGGECKNGEKKEYPAHLQDDCQGKIEALDLALMDGHHQQQSLTGMKRNPQQIQELQQQAVVDQMEEVIRQVHIILSKIAQLSDDYQGPRLFIVLPKEFSTRQTHHYQQLDETTLTEDQFRVHFLCSCSDLTLHASLCNSVQNSDSFVAGRNKPRTRTSSSSSGSIYSGGSIRSFVMSNGNLSTTSGSADGSIPALMPTLMPSSPHEVHFIRHGGYDLVRPTEFFQQYGIYVLRLLQMLKLGISTAGYTVSALLPPSKNPDSKIIGVFERTLEPAVNQTIQFLENLLTEHQMSEVSTALESLDMSGVHEFLKPKGSNGIMMGGLYRVISSEGCVHWVCQDHHRDVFHNPSTKELQLLTGIDGGVFSEQLGRIEISLTNSSHATRFYKTLVKKRSVQELCLSLKWEISYSDAKNLRDTLRRSNIVVLDLTCSASQSPAEILNKNKRAEPLWHILSDTKVRSFSLRGYSGFFKKVSSDMRQSVNELKVLYVSDEIEWDKDSIRITELLRSSPRLKQLTLTSSRMYETYHMIRDAASRRCPVLSKLVIQGVKSPTLGFKDQGDEQIVAHLGPKQVLVRMDVTIPNLAPYTRLFSNIRCISSIHLGCRVSLLSIGKHLLDMAQQPDSHLQELQIHCYVSEFHGFYDAFRKTVLKTTDVIRPRNCGLKRLHLYRGGNRMVTSNLRDPEALSLELLELQIHKSPLLQLIQRYGSKLTKLRTDGKYWIAAHSAALLDAICRQSRVSGGQVFATPPRSRLTHLYQTVADVDASLLEDLIAVIEHSPDLQEFHINVNQSFHLDKHRSEQWINFMNTVGEKITSIVFSCQNPKDWTDAFDIARQRGGGGDGGRARFPALVEAAFVAQDASRSDVVLKMLMDGAFAGFS
ncbi:hypothetical protein EDD11_002015 [Mortierella claussenii]|nr:hypothetical protein EDD11_002015 [Mortierella claussenii]